MLMEVMENGSNWVLDRQGRKGQAVDCSMRYGTRRDNAGER